MEGWTTICHTNQRVVRFGNLLPSASSMTTHEHQFHPAKSTSMTEPNSDKAGRSSRVGTGLKPTPRNKDRGSAVCSRLEWAHPVEFQRRADLSAANLPWRLVSCLTAICCTADGCLSSLNRDEPGCFPPSGKGGKLNERRVNARRARPGASLKLRGRQL